MVRPMLSGEDVIEPYLKLYWLTIALMNRDYREEIHDVQRMIVMMGRYCGQNMDSVEDWEISKLRQRAKILFDLVAEENKSSVPNGAAGHPRP